MVHKQNPTIKSKPILIVLLLIIATVIAYLNFNNTESNTYNEPALLLMISLLLLLWFIQAKVVVSFKPIEILSVLLFLVLAGKDNFSNSTDALAVCFCGFLIVLYFALKIIFTKHAAINKVWLLVSTLFILLLYIFFAVHHCLVAKNTISTLYLPNNSIFSILLATQLSFIVPLVLPIKKQKPKIWLSYIILLFAITLLILTKGRAGWLGFTVAIFYTAYSFIKKDELKRIIVYVGFPLCALLFSVLYFYKSDSSSGRLLVYKVSASMLKNNWLLGIGHGQFKVKYNLAQAQYFSTHSIDSREALLADNTYYAFNDFYQFIIEHGLIGFAFLFLLGYLFYKQIQNTLVDDASKPLFVSAVASLTCIFVGALFSYPLLMFPIIFQGLLSFAIICSFPQKINKDYTLSKNRNNIFKISLVIISALLCVHFYFLLAYHLKSKEAFDLNRVGFKTKALNIHNELNKSYIKDGNINYLYAQQLYYVNRVEEARVVMAKSKSLYLSHEVYKLSAEIETELKNYAQAEKDYKTAVCMVPNRMLSRKNLLDFYMDRKDTTSALFWANSIINMPVKIISEKTESIQMNTRIILKQISR